MVSRPIRLAVTFSIGLAGLSVLVALTDFQELFANLLPLIFFILLSIVVKRAGVHAAPDTLHSLVGIVDVAAIFIFGPAIGAWVPAASSLLYVFIYRFRRGQQTLGALLESPLYSAGVKCWMALASGGLYVALGGPVPLRDLNLAIALPVAAALAVWFALDDVAWALWEWLHIGRQEFYKLFRSTLSYSILVELLPLPFSTVIAVVYQDFGGITGPIFLLMAAGLVQAAFMLQRYADAQADLNRRSEELMALNEFGQSIARAGFDADQVVELLIQYAARVSGADVLRLELLTLERDQVEVYVESRGRETQWTRGQLALSPVAAYLNDNPASMRVQDLSRERLPFAADETVEGQPARPHVDKAVIGVGARSAIFVPLFANSQVYGVLTALKVKPGAFLRDDERNLNVMAGQAAVALDNARLYTIERRRASQLAIVSQVSQRVAQFLDLDLLLSQVLREIRDRFGYSNVHIFVPDEDRKLVFRASTHPLGDEWWERREHIPAGQGLVGWVFANKEPLLAGDVTRDPRYLPGPGYALIDTRSELAVPLLVGENVVGVLDVQSEEVAKFGDEDLFVLKTLAAQIAIAIEDARLYASQKEEAWYLNVLLQVAENLADTATLDEALETVVRITPILVGISRCAIFLVDDANQTLRAAKQYGLGDEQQARFKALSFPVDANAPGSVGRIFETREPVSVDHIGSNGEADAELAETFASDSMLITPLIYRGAIIGAMLVDVGGRPRPFSPHEIQILMGISNQAAIAVENARLNEEAETKKRFEYELGLARQIQTSFLPSECPYVPGFQVAAAWRAAREVSGDFYDFYLAGGRHGFSIADVSDKGMPAALFMVLTRTLIRAMAIGKPTPKEALERANDLILADAQTDMFATAIYGVLDAASGEFTFSNAGHNPPLWYRRDEEDLVTLRTHGLALAVRPSIELPEQCVKLGPGDALLLYTDGVTDALNLAGEEFGMERLSHLLAANHERSAQEGVEEILKAVSEFGQGARQFDDMTMVLIKRTNNGYSPPQ